MASDDKKTKTSPAPKNETAVKKEAAAKNKRRGSAEKQDHVRCRPIQG